MDGYVDIIKAAKQNKAKIKNITQKKDLKQTRKRYLEKQATRVCRNFKHWIENRRREFIKNPLVQLQRMETRSRKKEMIVESSKHSGNYCSKARQTQPEELSFLFMKVMDEIAKTSKKVQKKHKLAERKEILKEISPKVNSPKAAAATQDEKGF